MLDSDTQVGANYGEQVQSRQLTYGESKRMSESKCVARVNGECGVASITIIVRVVSHKRAEHRRQMLDKAGSICGLLAVSS